MQRFMSPLASVRRRLADPDTPPYTPQAREGGPVGGASEVGAEHPWGLGFDADVSLARRRGRGAQTTATGRFEPRVLVAFDDGWQSIEDLPPFKTEVAIDTARKVITRNASPDIPFDRSINPYRGCEHGCIYCFARPTHAYLGM